MFTSNEIRVENTSYNHNIRVHGMHSRFVILRFLGTLRVKLMKTS